MQRDSIRDGRLKTVICVLLVAVAVLLAACQDGSSTVTVGVEAGPSGDAAADAAGSRPVTFVTDDGLTLGGHLFGAGEAGIILAHMYPADQTSWFPTARRLADQGYLVLTFDFRGYGESEGDKDIAHLDRDMFAALMACADQGAARIVMVGASMGGTASLIAADLSQPLSRLYVAGVATLSAPVEFRGLSAAEAVPRLRMPLLLVAAEDDSGAAGARELMKLSGDSADLQIVPGTDHGTDLLEGDQAAGVWDLLSAFIRRTLPLDAG